MGFGLETDEQAWDVTPLKFVHSARAAKTFVDAFADDPLLRYLRAGQERTLFMRVIERLMLTIALPFWMYQKICFTVMAGRSFIIMDPPKTAAGPRKPCRLFGKLIAFVVKGLHVSRTAEQKKRSDEFDEKLKNLTAETLGDRVDRMFRVSCLATEPASQGRGYGSALMQATISLTDITNQALWLVTNTEENVRFYNMHGLKTMGETILGEGNETWHEAPVVVRLMVREPRRGRGSITWEEKAAVDLV